MTGQLTYYLERKAAAIEARRADWMAAREKAVVRLNASSKLAGNTGVRQTRMGEHVMVSDSAPGMAGHALGPTAPEMLLGALASCLLHTYVIQACLLNVPLDTVEIEISGSIDMSVVIGMPGDDAPLISDLTYTAHLTGPLSDDDIARMHAAVDASCPVLNTLRMPVSVVRKG
ncbi:MAG: OsmC family protein [Chloroflexota bacterium]|nr:OsmC family protein [Chloroflexota bacterium]